MMPATQKTRKMSSNFPVHYCVKRMLSVQGTPLLRRTLRAPPCSILGEYEPPPSILSTLKKKLTRRSKKEMGGGLK